MSMSFASAADSGCRRQPPRAAAPAAEPSALPPAPQSVEDTGLSPFLLAELLAKVMFQFGQTRLTALSRHLCLSPLVTEQVCQFMRRESLVEVARRGHQESDVAYDLTPAGRERAAEWLARNGYAGPAPVPLEAYAERVRAQSVAHQRPAAAAVRAAFADLVVPPSLVDRLGTAFGSGRPLLLYGPSGAGKTYLAERLQRLLQGAVAIPHAVAAHGEVIRVFDPAHHRPVGEVAPPHSALDASARPDARWQLCERPVVAAGGELTLEMLDLVFDERSGHHAAPPHLKANNGLFIVDDLGRQAMTPRQLMNRWIVPMDRSQDHLMLRSGAKFAVPFDTVLVFSTNLDPATLDDAAFLRRLGHKIAVGPLSRSEYRTVFERVCASEGVAVDDEAFTALLERYHVPTRRPLLACYPRDLLQLVSARATYLGTSPALTPELLDWAWHAYFSTVPDPEPPRLG